MAAFDCRLEIGSLLNLVLISIRSYAWTHDDAYSSLFIASANGILKLDICRGPAGMEMISILVE